MLRVDEALAKILSEAGSQPIVELSLGDALGRVLAQPVVADFDSPPFDKAMMDGYAVLAADLPDGKASLNRVGEILAGQVWIEPLRPGQAVQIMTGAPVPPGCDAVVMVERTSLQGNTVSIEDPEFCAGQNIMPRGQEFTNGERVLEPGHRLGPAELGLLATVGCVRPQVYRQPSIAILSTGDEIVSPEVTPRPGQIRNSNESTVAALAQMSGATVVRMGTVGDDEQQLTSRIAEALVHDLVILSGGVSAGKRDLVPGVLASLGVATILHGVDFKPGKPLWVGRKENTIVFGLPGNPVSVLCCFEVFVKSALRCREHVPDPEPRWIPIPLAEDFAYSARRTTYHPARTSLTKMGLVVQPVAWHGSPDLRALTESNALMVLPIGQKQLPAGTSIDVVLLDRFGMIC